jgi:hypothetical protein
MKVYLVFWIGKIEVLLQGGASDIEIPEKEQAENIKQLLMGKFKNCK